MTTITRQNEGLGSTTSHFRLGTSGFGFTIVELMVVVGIIALLLGILIPSIIAGRRGAEEAATRQFMDAMSIAIVAYQTDSTLGGSYPPSDDARITRNTFGLPSSSYSGWQGGEIIVQAMLGNSGSDGQSGLGFRNGGGSVGRVYGPYLEPDKYEVGQSPRSGSLKVFTDYWQNPICYYRVINGQITEGDNASIDDDGPNFDGSNTDEYALRAAPFVLYSRGADLVNGNAEEREDDIIVVGN